MNQTSEMTEATVAGETWVSADDMGEGTREEREAFARGFAEVLREGYARIGWEIDVSASARARRGCSRRATRSTSGRCAVSKTAPSTSTVASRGTGAPPSRRWSARN